VNISATFIRKYALCRDDAHTRKPANSGQFAMWLGGLELLTKRLLPRHE
jgi:hypothetical protein